MKKIQHLCLVVALTASVLTGCGGGSGSDTTQTDTTSTDTTPTDTTPTADIFEEIALFNAERFDTYTARVISNNFTGSTSEMSRGEEYNSENIQNSRDKAYEIGENYYCYYVSDDTNNPSCTYLLDQNSSLVSMDIGSVNNTTIGLSINAGEKGISEFRYSFSSPSSFLDGATTYSMTHTPDVIQQLDNIVGNFTISTYNLSLINDNLTGLESNGSLSCTNNSCSGLLQISSILHDSENNVWVGKTYDSSNTQKTVIIALSPNNDVITAYYVDGAGIKVISGYK